MRLIFIYGLPATGKLTVAEELSKPSAEGAFSLDGTIAGVEGTLCLHETYHVGQVGYLRKRLGYGQAVG